MKSVFIVGRLGNMGRRYEAILKTMGISVHGIDSEFEVPKISLNDVDGFIIASPTKLHTRHVDKYLSFGKPVLCEKPICFSSDEISQINQICGMKLKNLRMVNQYAYLVDDSERGETIYDYYNTGKDGLAWDCINIIGLSTGKVTIDNKSPVWFCQINGEKLAIADMDKAYVAMIKDWVNCPRENWEYIVDAHRKVEKWLKS